MDGRGHYQYWGDGLVPSASFDFVQFLSKVFQIDTKACASESMLFHDNLAGRQVFLGGLNGTSA